MTSRTTCAIAALFFIALALWGFVDAVVSGEPAGFSVWGPLVISNVWSAAWTVLKAKEVDHE
jgi:hypothetical protein